MYMRAFRYWSVIICSVFVVCTSKAYADMPVAMAAPASNEYPPLAVTNLYTQIAHGCENMDAGKWVHPIHKFLDDKNIPLEKMQLCNSGSYPIFFVRFPYDPQADTAAYFKPLYAQVADDNGWHSYAFVSIDDHTIVEVTVNGGDLTLAYESYSQ